jgi:hypothetical protein
LPNAHEGAIDAPKRRPNIYVSDMDTGYIVRSHLEKLHSEEVLRMERRRKGLSSEKNQTENDCHLISRGIL